MLCHGFICVYIGTIKFEFVVYLTADLSQYLKLCSV
jgi:hypothetical protein